MKTNRSRHAMQGLSVAGWMVAIVIVVVFATAAMKIIPPMLEFNTIKGLIESVLSDTKLGLQSAEEIRNDIGKRFLINNVSVIGANDLEIVREGSDVVIGVDYEVRENFFSNIDFAITFKQEFRQSVR